MPKRLVSETECAKTVLCQKQNVPKQSCARNRMCQNSLVPETECAKAFTPLEDGGMGACSQENLLVVASSKISENFLL